MGYEFDPWSENWEPTCHEANSAACCNCWAQAPKWKILPDAGRILCASTKPRCSHIRKKKKRVKTPSMSLSPEAIPSSYSPTGDFLCLWRTDLGAAGLSGPLSSCLCCQRDQQRKSLMKAIYPDVQPLWSQRRHRKASRYSIQKNLSTWICQF